MNTQQIIADLEAERDRLNAAITALQGSGRRNGRRKGRGRQLSAESRRRISEGMKKRWAARKRAIKG